MKLAAKLRIVTVDDKRTEFVTEGWIQTDLPASFGYSDGDCSLEVTLGGDTATVTRSGDSAYTLTLDRSRTTEADFGYFAAKVRTDMLLSKVSAQSIEFAARYSIGNTRDTTEIIIKANRL